MNQFNQQPVGRLTRTALYYIGGVAIYCSRLFTRPNEQMQARLTQTVTQLGLLFDGIADALDSGAEPAQPKEGEPK